MDNQALDRVIQSGSNRQFWIVLWGYPEQSPDEGVQVFDQTNYVEGLTRNEPEMRIGDILFVHRIKVSQIIYVGEVVYPPRQPTREESEKEEWRKRWLWGVRIKNLTPTYGQYWRSCAEKTFTLCKRFNQLQSQNPANISRLNYGSHVKIPRAFAQFLLEHIRSLDMDKVTRINLFHSWLSRHRGRGTVGSRLSNCRVGEKWEGDLDEHFNGDRLHGLLERLTYSKEDERYNRPARHNIPIGRCLRHKPADVAGPTAADD